MNPGRVARWKCMKLDLVDDDQHLFRETCRRMVAYTTKSGIPAKYDEGPRRGHESCGFITPIGVFQPGKERRDPDEMPEVWGYS